MNERDKYSYLDPVTNGAKVLTEYFGDDSWKGRINPDTLVMSSPCKCILGQLFGDYWNGLRTMGLDDNSNHAALGFDVVFDEGVYIHLTETWREYLAKVKP
jgi:hypothetical protein